MTVRYRPHGLRELVSSIAQHLPGRQGLRAHNRLKKAWGLRARADFDACIAKIGEGDICMDVGANLGEFTEILAATGAEVHCYEPDPFALDRLRARFAGRERIHLHALALGAVSGTAELRRSVRFAEDAVRHSQSSSIVFDDPGRFGAETITVELRSFAEELRRLGRQVAIVKMDIEGAEFDILEQVFADPEAFPVTAMFVETHERRDPARREQVRRMRRSAEVLMRPSVNLYWP